MLREMTEDIYMLDVRFPADMGQMNCYLIKGEAGYTVIDTGMRAKESIEIWEKVLDTGISIEKVVLTHVHHDHIGLAKWFQDNYGIPIVVSNRGYEEMKKYGSPDLYPNLSELLHKHGAPDVAETIGVEQDVYHFYPDGFFNNHDYLKLGDHLYQAIWTPGHAPDHFCFYNEEKKVLIIGDHVLNDVSPVIGLWLGTEKNVLHDYLASLELIKPFSAELVLPGHGEPIENLPDRVENLQSRHAYRLKQMKQNIKDEGSTVYEICMNIYGKLDIILYLSPFMSTLTRLIYLEEKGEIKRHEQDGKVTFHVAASNEK